AASSMMSWRTQLAGPDDFDKVYFEGSRLLDAVESSLMMLAVFALVVIVTAVINARASSRRAPRPALGVATTGGVRHRDPGAERRNHGQRAGRWPDRAH